MLDKPDAAVASIYFDFSHARIAKTGHCCGQLAIIETIKITILQIQYSIATKNIALRLYHFYCAFDAHSFVIAAVIYYFHAFDTGDLSSLRRRHAECRYLRLY